MTLTLEMLNNKLESLPHEFTMILRPCPHPRPHTQQVVDHSCAELRANYYLQYSLG